MEHAGVLDHPLRRLYESPKRILRPYVGERMSVLDIGCGPGFFTLEMARRVGGTGRVVAADLQQGMLDRARRKLADAGLASAVTFHLCGKDAIGLADTFDFILVFHVLHEAPDQGGFLRELKALLAPTGMILLAEPRWHVTPGEFRKSIDLMRQAGFAVLDEPRILFSRAVLLAKTERDPERSCSV